MFPASLFPISRHCGLSLFFFLNAVLKLVFIYFLAVLSPACGILVPWLGIEPMSPAIEVQVLNHQTVREVPCCLSLMKAHQSQSLHPHGYISSHFHHTLISLFAVLFLSISHCTPPPRSFRKGTPSISPRLSGANRLPYSARPSGCFLRLPIFGACRSHLGLP